MDGIFIINKPAGISSARVVDHVRRATGIRKSGHAGTLDPAATGVLLICQGRATKLVERMMDLEKVYVAAARLDVTSSSFDSDRPLEPVFCANIPEAATVRDALASFVGEIEQTPPAVSAVKVGGIAAYKRERRGEKLVLAPRKVRIYALALRNYAWPDVEFEMRCGRGTYVRSLIRDVGVRLGCGGCLTTLERTSIGPFHVDNAVTVDDLPNPTLRDKSFIEIELAKTLLDAAKPPAN
ncbi:MAG: tRNA pseudouridine(55) synthase TruB [Phycisphaerae bacterium]